MSDVTGPIGTLPGSTHPIKLGTMCDRHITRPAVVRVQGETDLERLESEVINILLKALDKSLPIEELCEKARDAWVESFR